MPFANQSYYDHYGVALDAAGYSWLWASLQACQIIGTMCSALILVPLMDMYGRKTTVMVYSNGILLVGLLCQMLAKPVNSFELFAVGQILGGIACGSVKVIFQLFAESTPTAYRGTVSLLYSSSIAMWCLLGIVLAFPFLFGSNEMWPWFFFPSVLPCILYFIAAYFVPESPKFLFLQKGDTAKAIEAIQYYHGEDADIAKILHRYEGEIVDEEHRNKRTIGYRHLLVNVVYRRALIICLVANICANWQLTTALVQYSNGLGLYFGLSAMESLTIILIMAIYYVIVRFVVAIVGVNRMGRVPLLIISASCTSLAVLILAIEMNMYKHGALPHWLKISMIFIWTFMLFSADGMSVDSITMMLVGEVAPNVVAGKILQVCIFVSQLISFIIVLTFPPLMTAFGSRVLICYSVLSALSAIIFYFFVPETRGTDVDDMIHKISICYVGQLRRASHELGDDTQPLLARPRLRKLTSYM
uniref:Major facilitator superfamily (MFS) profile domain-containing protein n=1 Tax=Plectus sambesii TaxID=2011161 RepID=A0A914WTH7_9BILA